MSQQKITIKDIAKLAEVSPGTVDRVIHGRGRVSADKKARVDKVLDDLDYQPNLIAKTLKNSKTCKIAVVMPDHEQDDYWKRAKTGVDRAYDEFKSFGITVDFLPFQAGLPSSFEDSCRQVLNDNYAAVLLAPILTELSGRLIRDCRERNIEVITFNTRISEPSRCFIGQDMHQSGRLAGNLIWLAQHEEGRILLVHIDETPYNTQHVFEKEKGIKSYLSDRGYPLEKIESLQLFRDQHHVTRELLDQVELNNDISAAYISTSRAYEVARLMKSHSPDAVIVGYDLINQNIELLNRHIITFLIDQNPVRQAYLGISYLKDLLVFGIDIPEDVILPLNIVTQENYRSVLAERI